MNFKKGDYVKFYNDSLIMPITYGIIIRINKKTARVQTSEGNYTIALNKLNFD